MKNRILCLLAGMVILLSACRGEASPLPYVEKQNENATAYETLYAIAGLPADDVRRKEFFAETEKNLGLNEERINTLILEDKGAIGTNPYKSGGVVLKSGGLANNKNTYWRNVHEGEKVAYLKVGETWKPWFLTKCGNPVREEPKVTATTPPPAPPQKEMRREVEYHQNDYKPCGCFQGQSRFVQSPTEIYSWGVSHTFNGQYRKTTCITDADYEETSEGRRLQ